MLNEEQKKKIDDFLGHAVFNLAMRPEADFIPLMELLLDNDFTNKLLMTEINPLVKNLLVHMRALILGKELTLVSVSCFFNIQQSERLPSILNCADNTATAEEIATYTRATLQNHIRPYQPKSSSIREQEERLVQNSINLDPHL